MNDRKDGWELRRSDQDQMIEKGEHAAACCGDSTIVPEVTDNGSVFQVCSVCRKPVGPDGPAGEDYD